MPSYGYICKECGAYREVVRSIHDHGSPPSHCGASMRRQFHSPSVVHGLVRETHLNTATGEVVRNDTEFKDQLKRNSERDAARLGIDVDYQPLAPGDAPGVDKAAAKEAMRKRAVNSGAVERKFVSA